MAAELRSARAGLVRRTCLLLLFGALLPLTAQSQSLSFLKKSPMSYFTQDDFELMTRNARAVLDAAEPDAERTWTNPRSGASGLAQSKGQFSATDGALCKHLRVVNRAKKLEDEATYTVCRYSGRGWVLNADAQPAH